MGTNGNIMLSWIVAEHEFYFCGHRSKFSYFWQWGHGRFLMKHYVEIEKQALIQMILNGFEAFVVKHGNKKRSGIEFHASLYGDIEFPEDNTYLRHIIKFISADTSAKMESGSVDANPEASALKEHLAYELGFYQLGMMHSHPYLAHEMSISEVRENGFNFSKGDLENFSEAIDEYEVGKGYHLEVLLTIKELKNANTVMDGRSCDNVFEFSVGNCKCFLRAQVLSKNEKKELQYDETILHCDYLEKNLHLDAEFGHIKPKVGRQRVLEYKAKK